MYTKNGHIHFIGIGGIGMSAIAIVLQEKGYRVSGCDACMNQKSITNLLKIGCTIACPNNSPACHDTSIDVVVYSAAIRQDNPEILAAKQRNIPVISRAEMLAQLMLEYKSIAIAGSHGKTTTSSLISHVLLETQRDPTIIIGGHLHSINSNGKLGQSNLLVAEADESDRSLTKLHPHIAIVTNISLEHLDTYRTITDIQETFIKFLKNLAVGGTAILCIDDTNTAELIPQLPNKLQQQVITYGFSQQADFYIDEYTLEPNQSTATVYYKKKLLGTLTLSIPGRYNLLNALATIAVAHILKIDFAMTAQALACFGGVDRRFTFKGIYKDAELFDDYGHHPKEINNILEVARKRAKNRLIVLFQPHRFSRTKELWNEFLAALSQKNIDHLIITDIYPASEQPLEGITSKKLVNELQQTIQKSTQSQSIHYAPADDLFLAAHKKLDELIQPNDLILFLGAGKINILAEKLI